MNDFDGWGIVIGLLFGIPCMSLAMWITEKLGVSPDRFSGLVLSLILTMVIASLPALFVNWLIFG